VVLACALLLAACGSGPQADAARARDGAVAPASAAAQAPAPVQGQGPAPAGPAQRGAADAQAVVQPLPGVRGGSGAPASTPAAVAAAPQPVPRNPRYVKLPPPAAVRTVEALQLQIARRLVEAHPDTSYTRTAPPRLLAIPVIEIELNQDGSVRNTRVLRHPSTGPEATTLALAAIRRAAPYGNVSALPRPWKVVEAFLFDDELRFKPRTLDLD
jgi:hypothetical protein